MKTINDKNQNNLRENPFGVPEGYFDSFESRLEKRMKEDSLENKINSDINKKPLGGKIIKLIKPVMGIAAGLILVLLLVHYSLKNNSLVLVSEQPDSSVVMQYEEELMAKSADLDEKTFYDVLITREDSTVSILSIDDPEKVITILSDELNDYDLYAEIIN
ncbi:MAG: hypothetical protein JJE45_06065 [Prolixibacteraceae bacterium]|nr:hypothetical protein [Prolixibacteraceae bacterium]